MKALELLPAATFAHALHLRNRRARGKVEGPRCGDRAERQQSRHGSAYWLRQTGEHVNTRAGQGWQKGRARLGAGLVALVWPVAVWAGPPAAEQLAHEAAAQALQAARERLALRSLADDFASRMGPHAALLAAVDRWLAAGNQRAASLPELVAWRPAIDAAERTAAACATSWRPLQQPRPANEQVLDIDPALPGRVRWACTRLVSARSAAQAQFVAAAQLMEGTSPAWQQLPQRYGQTGRLGYAQWLAVQRLDQMIAERSAVLRPVADALGFALPTGIFADGVAAKEALLAAMARGRERWPLPEGTDDHGFAAQWRKVWQRVADQGPFAGSRTLLRARWSPGPWQPLVAEDGSRSEVREVQLLIRETSGACWLLWATARRSVAPLDLALGDDVRLVRCPLGR